MWTKPPVILTGNSLCHSCCWKWKGLSLVLNQLQTKFGEHLITVHGGQRVEISYFDWWGNRAVMLRFHRAEKGWGESGGNDRSAPETWPLWFDSLSYDKLAIGTCAQPGLVCRSGLRSPSLGQCFKMTVLFHRPWTKIFVSHLDLKQRKDGPCAVTLRAAAHLHTSGMS